MSELVKPCPFCGRAYDPESHDTLYPGIWYREYPNGDTSYHTRKDAKPGDKQMWDFNCPAHEGGCGAEISGHSREEAIEKWNRRA